MKRRKIAFRNRGFLLPAAVILLLGILTASGCIEKQIMDGPDMVRNSYQQISQEKAKEMMEKDDGHVIVDVRRQDEYDGGHIPGAILIPNEEIGTERPKQLSDPNQIILVYCRSGNRSKQASQKLADLGYKNVYEFGGILDWTGETVTESVGEKETPTEAGKEKETDEMEYDAVRLTADLVMEVNGKIYYPGLSENSSAEAFFEKLKEGKLTLELHDYGNFEKVGPLPWSLPRSDEEITTSPGDIILYQGNQLTVYYDVNTWEFTRLGRINDVTKEELLGVLGEGDVSVSFWLEWSE